MTESEAKGVCWAGVGIIDAYNNATFPVTRSNNPNLSDFERCQVKEYEDIVEFVREKFRDTSKPATLRVSAVARLLEPYYRPLQGVCYIEHVINRLCYMAHTGNIKPVQV